jgi:hypothetical protein
MDVGFTPALTESENGEDTYEEPPAVLKVKWRCK